MKRLILLVAALSVPVVASGLGQVEGDGWGLDFRGFALGNVSVRTNGRAPPDGSEFLLAETRLRLDVTGWSDVVELEGRMKLDGVLDAVTDDAYLDLREAYLDYTTGDWDLRLGRQVITWGVGDLLFINDIFPKDWESFFAGRPLEYLKVGVDGLRTRYSTPPLNAELVIIPRFEPDTVPTSDRFILNDIFPPGTPRTEELPATTVENTQIALRLYRRLAGFDVSAYASRGYWGTPSQRPDDPNNPTTVTSFYPPLSVYGLSAQGQALGGILSLEGGYYDSWDDRAGDDPTIPNSQVRFLVGYQKQLWEDFTFGAQYYAEIMTDYAAYERSLPAGFPAQERYRDVVTLNLIQLLQHQTWRLSLFTFYSPAENDYLLRPAVAYDITDKLSATLGANIFGGEKSTTFFGQLDENDNVYFWLRYDY